MVLGTGFGDPATHASNTTSFSLIYWLGRCATGAVVTTTGTITGWCGMATGTGSTSNGHAFSVAWNGEEMTFSGDMTGTFAVTDEPTDGKPCSAGTADRFLVHGTVVLSHTTLPAEMCSGEFRMTLTVPYGDVLATSQLAQFTLRFVAGTCAQTDPIEMTGTMLGTCFSASGTGTSNTGYNSTIRWATPLITFTGPVDGSAFISEDPNSPGSCATTGETEFIVLGTLIRP